MRMDGPRGDHPSLSVNSTESSCTIRRDGSTGKSKPGLGKPSTCDFLRLSCGFLQMRGWDFCVYSKAVPIPHLA